MRESRFYQEIMDEGKRIGTRKDIAAALEIRFGSEVAAEFRDALEKIENLRSLDNLHYLAICCRRRTEFRRWFASPEEAVKRIPPPYLRKRKRADRKAQSGRKKSS